MTKKIFILLPMILLLSGCTYLVPKNNESKTGQTPEQKLPNEAKQNQEQEFNNSGQAKAVENKTDLWQLYSNEETGFSLKYPHNVSLNTPGGDLSLFITVKDLDTLENEAPMGMGKENLLSVKESLLNQEYGNIIDWPLEASKKVRTINGINTQEFMALGRFEVCDVVFERTVNFFLDNYFITITLKAPRNKIVESMPGYFGQNTANCGDILIWNEVMKEKFYNNISNNIGSKIALDWYNTFDEIIETIEFTMPEYINEQVFNDRQLLGTWQSIDDEKYTMNFTTSTKIDFYNHEETNKQNYQLVEDILSAGEEDDLFKYQIKKLDEENLEMIYLRRGNILRFKKVYQKLK